MSILKDLIVATKMFKFIIIFWSGISVHQRDTTPDSRSCFIVEMGETLDLKNKQKKLTVMKAGITYRKSESFINTENKEMYLVQVWHSSLC